MIWLNYYVDGVRIRKTTNLKNTAENIKIVKNQIIPALNTKIYTGDIYKKKPQTFEYYGEIFLKQKSANKSYWLRKGYYERVIEFFKGQSIGLITRLDIKTYLISLNIKSISKNTYKSCIKEIFELAVDDGVINVNPAINIRLKADEHKSIDYYTREEVEKLLSVAKGVTKAYLEIAFNAGLRVGEILGLQISDFRDDGYIYIQRTRTRGVIGSGKTSNAVRKVPYNSYMLSCVKAILTNHIFIFQNINDAHLFRCQWKNVCIDAGVKRYRLYLTRHTFATLMLKENIVSINELAGLLGHSSPKVTLAYYTSVIDVKNIDLGVDFALFGHYAVTAKKNIV